jgi:Tol biopolymer transport system component
VTLAQGARLGPYEIVCFLGAGGMGEVYRATDSRLGRTVAIKILPALAAARSDQRARFEREARAIAALNHPHICTVHDVGQQDGLDFLVLEYVEGETLADRLAKRPVSLDLAIAYAIQIAEALAAAHARGIVHRDLKPANVMITGSGIKLLDFGVAKWTEAALPADSVHTPTPGSVLTAEDVLVGTLNYMAPEQLEGGAIDSRTDIFALGAVTYEMVTGFKAFTGTSRASIIAAVLEREPAVMTAVQPLTPPALNYAVTKCLAKDPDARWQTARDLGSHLSWIRKNTGPAAAPVASRRLVLALAVTATLLAVAGALWLAYARGARPEPLPVTFTEHLPSGLKLASAPMLSPDGRWLVYAAEDSAGRVLLRARALVGADVQPRVLPGTDGASSPFWSPDSREVGFYADGKLKRVDLTGGQPRLIADLGSGRTSRGAYTGGASWGPDGTILFATSGFTGLSSVSAEGGVSVPLTRLDQTTGEDGHRFPVFLLPDGRHFLFSVVSSNAAEAGVYVGSLDSPARTRILDLAGRVAYASTGHLVFRNGEALVAQSFDFTRVRLLGSPVTIASNLGLSGLGSNTDLSVSNSGTLAYVGTAPHSALEWFDRSGKSLGAISGAVNLQDPDLSPDETVVVATRGRDTKGGAQLWTIDLPRGVASRVGNENTEGLMGMWSRDGDSIIHSATGPGRIWNIYRTKTAGTAAVELLLATDEPKRVHDVSDDGQYIVYATNNPTTYYDLWYWKMSEPSTSRPVPYLRTAANEFHGRISPDGRWMAYASNESGQFEVYVQSFPAPGGKRRISTEGGTEPQWRRDGRELFYLAAGNVLTAVPIPNGDLTKVGIPAPLFQTRLIRAARNHYAVTADGRRFLIDYAAEQTASTSMTIILNWAAGLRKP